MAKLTQDQLKTIQYGDELLTLLKYKTPPFDPFQIANDLGIEINPYVTLESLSRSGSISMDDSGKVVIWVNPFDARVRKRFTAAHEIGHYINGDLKEYNNIEDYPSTLYRTDGNSNPQEIAANKFAAQLLMPKAQIYDYGNKIIAESEGGSIVADAFINKMAKIFDVSRATMTYRLKGFGIVK